MKKILTLALVSIFSVLIFTGCSSQEKEAKELIIGEWKYNTYFEMINGKKDSSLAKYFKDDSDVIFYSDGTMEFEDGSKDLKWEFIKYDEEYECYIYLVNDKYTFCIYSEDPNELYKSQDFEGKVSMSEAAGRSISLDLLNNLDNLWRDGIRIPEEGTQFWKYEKSE